MSLVSTSWRLHAKISRIWANIHPLFVTCIPPTQWISHTHPSMLTWDIWGGREKSISYFSLLLIGIVLPSVNSLCSHCEERTADIFPRMLEAQMTLWHHYDIKVGSSGPPTTPSTSLVQRPPQTMLLWALLYIGRPLTRSLSEQLLTGQGTEHSKFPREGHTLCPLQYLMKLWVPYPPHPYGCTQYFLYF